MAVKSNSSKLDIKKLEEKSKERLTRLFLAFDENYFFGKMSKKVKIQWSKRMTECAGTTLSAYKKKPITVSLSRPILELRPLSDLLETLLHEMIHAFLWAEKVYEKEEHGPIFHDHIKRLRKLSGIDVQVLHDFADECGLLLKHVWRCNGSCRKTSHNRGYIRRAINRKPSPSEKWFREHSLECGGTFVKIKAPSPTKIEFDYRLDEEIEEFLVSTFPKYTQSTSQKNLTVEDPLLDKRERSRRSVSQTNSNDEELPEKSKNINVKTIKTPKTKTPKTKFSKGLKVKMNLTKRKATPYRFSSRIDDLFTSDTSFSSSSTFSDSPVFKNISNKMEKMKNEQKTDKASPLRIPKYVWQCDGKCKEKSPKYGRVERCINKPPSQREKWFLKHRKHCGGTFVRI